MDLLQERAQVVQQVIDLTTGTDTQRITNNIKQVKSMLIAYRRKECAEYIAELMTREGDMDMADIEELSLRKLSANGFTLTDPDGFFEDINRKDVNFSIVLHKIYKYEQQ